MSSALASTLCEFLSASAHLILYVRRVYPEEVFERRRLFDVAVYRSRHAELNDYISNAVHALQALLQRGEADAMVLNIMGASPTLPLGAGSRSPRLLESFRFEIRPNSRGGGAGSSYGDDHVGMRGATAGARERSERSFWFSGDEEADVGALQMQLRGFLLKLHVCDAVLAPLPVQSSELSFSIELHSQPAHCEEPLPTELLEHWIESAQQRHQSSETAGRSCYGGVDMSGESEALPEGAQIEALKSCSNAHFSLELLVLEAASKT